MTQTLQTTQASNVVGHHHHNTRHHVTNTNNVQVNSNATHGNDRRDSNKMKRSFGERSCAYDDNSDNAISRKLASDAIKRQRTDGGKKGSNNHMTI